MARSSSPVRGVLVVTVYLAIAAVAACLLAPSCVPQESAEGVAATDRWHDPGGDLFMAVSSLFVLFVGVGFVVLIAAASFLDSVAKTLRETMGWIRTRAQKDPWHRLPK